jgi:tRNA(fMet)-specific endonuclease VapC
VSYLLDTNVCIAFLAGKEASVRDKLLSVAPSEVSLCSVVKAELFYGARRSAHVERNLGRLAEFFEAFESLPFDDAAAGHYGLLRTELEARGTPIGANDLMIASIALASQATLVTRNQREFFRVPALAVTSW